MAQRRLRILHLAFEDHLKPQSGGGARRSWEINRRLAATYDITVVTAKYPGCAPRVENGVRYRQSGMRGGYQINVMSYHFSIPWVVLRARADLIIEDFASPISSALVPLWTRSPTLAIVQWLFATETSRQYRLPFFIPEWLGLRLHHRYLAVSEYIGNEIRARSPGAQVDVVYAGISDELISTPRLALSQRRREILFLGRFQLKAKGIDSLIEAFRLIAHTVDADLVLVGDGPERDKVERAVLNANLGSRIRIASWVEGVEKFELLRSCALVVVPSRYETFGMVALEAMAAGTPVIGFDIPALQEIVPPECGVLVEGFDVKALSAAIVAMLQDDQIWEAMSQHGREHAATFTWDAAAKRQQDCYESAAETRRGRGKYARTRT